MALILNPVWALGDYFTIPAHFTDFFIFRMAVSVAVALGLIFRSRFIHRPWGLAFIPFMGIALQNAYMYSVMEVPELEKHTFAFIALFIGAGMFLLWKPVYSIIVVVVTFIASIIFFMLMSPLQLSEILINGGMLTGTVALFTILLINTRTNLTRREIVARLALGESNKKLAYQNKEIEEKNKDIQDSIKYAQRIQHAILPHNEDIAAAFPDHFILYQPKDIIAGDFYWFEDLRNGDNRQVLIAAADCTGHGVPGAMVSVVCSNALNRAVLEYGITEPGAVLDSVREMVIEAFETRDANVKDGMDISLVSLELKMKNEELKMDDEKSEITSASSQKPVLPADTHKTSNPKPQTHPLASLELKMKNEELKMANAQPATLNSQLPAVLRWSGANNPLWIIRNGEMITFKPDKQPIGYYAAGKPFTTHTFDLQKNDLIYLFTDGLQDQFGGTEGKKYKASNLMRLLLSIHTETMPRQREMIEAAFEKWRGSLEQVDDICMIGIRV